MNVGQQALLCGSQDRFRLRAVRQQIKLGLDLVIQDLRALDSETVGHRPAVIVAQVSVDDGKQLGGRRAIAQQ